MSQIRERRVGVCTHMKVNEEDPLTKMPRYPIYPLGVIVCSIDESQGIHWPCKSPTLEEVCSPIERRRRRQSIQGIKGANRTGSTVAESTLQSV